MNKTKKGKQWGATTKRTVGGAKVKGDFKDENKQAYEFRIAREAYVKRGQRLRIRAKNKPNKIIAREAHIKGQIVYNGE